MGKTDSKKERNIDNIVGSGGKEKLIERAVIKSECWQDVAISLDFQKSFATLLEIKEASSEQSQSQGIDEVMLK